MPKTGTPAWNSPSGAFGAPSAYTEAGPPDKMIAFGCLASISLTGIVDGTISEYTWHSRTQRAISCAYCAPKSTTRTVSGVSVPSPSGACTAVSLVGLRGRLLGPRIPVGRSDAVHLAHPDPGDAPPVQLGHGQVPAGDLRRLP